MNAFSYIDKPTIKKQFIPVDQWVPNEKDIIFRTCKGAVILPVSGYFGVENEALDRFILSTKRSYNSDNMHKHLPLYMNYFEKFYDHDHELLITLFRFKYLIDYQPYSREQFMNDIRRYILSDSLMVKAHLMNEDNYSLELDKKDYKNDKNPCLQYKDKHAKVLMWISLVVNMMIPVLTHYAFMNKVQNVNQFLLDVYDIVLEYAKQRTGINIYSKLAETTLSNINKNARDNSRLWEFQDIRGENTTIHSFNSVNNILLNIVPKYVYSMNIVFLNYTSIRNSIGFQITEIGYEFDFVPLSGSKRDLDQNSEYDKYESFLIKQNEALYIQNKVNAEKTIEYIEYLYGPFDEKEMTYYKKRLANENGDIINGFQRSLIFNLFYKYFGDPVSAFSINKDDYVKLMIAAKNLLISSNMVVMPYIISSKIERLQIRKCINRRELTELSEEPLFIQIMDKYSNDEKVKNHILSLIATILASDFRIIDFNDDNIDGRLISNIPGLIRQELLMYIAMI